MRQFISFLPTKRLTILLWQTSRLDALFSRFFTQVLILSMWDDCWSITFAPAAWGIFLGENKGKKIGDESQQEERCQWSVSVSDLSPFTLVNRGELIRWRGNRRGSVLGELLFFNSRLEKPYRLLRVFFSSSSSWNVLQICTTSNIWFFFSKVKYRFTIQIHIYSMWVLVLPARERP